MPGRPPINPKTDESSTVERILAAAAPLFAENGFEATGVRAIAAAAGVNIAAVNYHFGSKDALVAAVVDRHMRLVNERRLAALDEALASAKKHPTVEAVMAAFIGPSVRFITDGDPANLLLMRLIVNRAKDDPENTGRLIRDAMAPTLGRFAAALALSSPKARKDALHEGLHLAVGAFLHSMTCTAMLDTLCPGLDRSPEKLTARLVAFTASGIRGLAAL
jgi:AcrR family transcriptional regulator